MLRHRILHIGRGKSVEDIHYVCQVHFLDGSDPVSVTYQKHTEGQFLIDHVCKSLDLIEKDYFGLRFLDAEKQRVWLDPRRSIHRQLKGISSPQLDFRVKFYPSDPSKLKEEITRYQIFMQLKRDLLSGRLRCPDEDAHLLAAYIIQSELGDYDAEEHMPDYVSEISCLPNQTAQHSQAIAGIHKTLLGLVPAEAEANFLKKACELEWYGVDPFTVTDLKACQTVLGITHRGISVFQNNMCTHLFKWSQIRRFEFEGRTFIVRLTNIENEDSSLLLKKKKPACGFKCESFGACKQLWKSAIEQNYFFTLHRASDAPKVVSSGGLFHRSSKFRLSGRCEEELHKSIAEINRKEPEFTRSVSNAQLVHRYNSLRSATLPSKWRPHGSSDGEDQGITVIETSIDDSFQSSSGALKDEIASSVIIEEDGSGTEQTPPVTSAEVVCEPRVSDNKEMKEVGTTPPPSLSVTPTAESPLPDVVGCETKTEATKTEAATADQANLDEQIRSLQRQLSDSLRSADLEVKKMEEMNGVEDGNLKDITSQIVADGLTSLEPPTAVPIVAMKGGRRCLSLCSVVRMFFVVLLISAVLMFLVLETHLDYPLITDLRDMPEVRRFASETYAPLRQAVVDQVGGVLGW